MLAGRVTRITLMYGILTVTFLHLAMAISRMSYYAVIRKVMQLNFHGARAGDLDFFITSIPLLFSLTYLYSIPITTLY